MKNSLIWYFLLSLFFLQAQDQVFLNSNQSLVDLNPSFAGSNGFIRNQASYRNRWPNLSGRNLSLLNCFDAFIKPINGGIAFTLQQDDFSYGTLKQNSIGIAYAQYLSFRDGDLKIVPSIQARYVNKVLDYNSLGFGDPLFTPGSTIPWQSGAMTQSRTAYLSFGSGLLVNYKNRLYLGSYVFNANQPADGFLGDTKLPYRLLLHGSYMKELNASSFLQFTARYSQQASHHFSQLCVNLVFLKKFLAGVGYVESNKSPLFNVGYRGDLFSVLASCDFTYSKYGRTSRSYELHLSYSLRNKKNRRSTPLIGFETW